jgi:hypothetical protein
MSLAPLETVPVDDREKIFEMIDRDGGVIVSGLLSPAVVDRLNADLDDVIESAPPGSRSPLEPWQVFHGSNTKRFCGLAAKSRTWVDEVLLHPLLLGWADRDLHETAGSYWLNTGQMMVVGPDSTTQMLHRDEENWPFIDRLGASGPEVTVSVMIALTSFTEEVGATRVVPGSHQWSDFASYIREDSDTPGEVETVPAVMEAGSGLLYSGKLLHGAGANQTDAWRRGLHTSYVAGWLCPEEANPLAVPLEVARTLPPKARQLLGYGSYDPGHTGGGRTWLIDFEDAALSVA